MVVPEQLENVTLVCKANVYFEGKVVSHAALFADGSKKTVGVIYPGQYHFGTEAPECMDVIAGSCTVKLDGSDAENTYSAGTAFEIPGNSGFDITIADGIMEYVCSYG